MYLSQILLEGILCFERKFTNQNSNYMKRYVINRVKTVEITLKELNMDFKYTSTF